MFSHSMADLLVILHFAFIVFVVAGGFLVLKWRRVAYIHVPSAVWGALVEFQGWICPLTPLEQKFRIAAGEAGYGGGFIQYYLLPVIYPDGLGRDMQFILGSSVVIVNLAVYGWVVTRYYRKK